MTLQGKVSPATCLIVYVMNLKKCDRFYQNRPGTLRFYALISLRQRFPGGQKTQHHGEFYDDTCHPKKEITSIAYAI